MSKSINTWISNAILESPAWNDLGGKAPQIYLHFLKRRTMEKIPGRKKEFRCKNGSGLTFSYKEACQLGFTNASFSRAIDSLVRHGFIDIARYGGGTTEQFTIYSLSERWKCFGTEEFTDVKRAKHNRGFCKPKSGHGN